MENKKNVNANLERYKKYFFLASFVVILVIVLIAFSWKTSSGCIAVNDTINDKINKKKIENTDEKRDDIYSFEKEMPKYPGGNIALMEFIAKNVKYPKKCFESSISGTVYIRFEVLKTGDVGKVEVIRGVDPLLDQEAIRVVKLLKNFKPGMQKGKAVNMWLSIPISFKVD